MPYKQEKMSALISQFQLVHKKVKNTRWIGMDSLKNPLLLIQNMTI